VVGHGLGTSSVQSAGQSRLQAEKQRRAESWSGIGAGYAPGYVTKWVCNETARWRFLFFSALSRLKLCLSPALVKVKST
jgi:hypothetical protein